MMLFVLIGVTAAFVTYIGQELRYAREREQLSWFQIRWDALDDLSHAREADRLRRRIAGLLASPKLYLRARRLLGPLQLDRSDLTAELELIDLTNNNGERPDAGDLDLVESAGDGVLVHRVLDGAHAG